MPEAVARKLHDFACEVRRIAYQVPAGQGEFALLQLSQRMAAEADSWLRRGPGPQFPGETAEATSVSARAAVAAANPPL